PSSTSVLFARGIIARLQTWPALRIAVHQNWGGPHSLAKQRWLASLLVDAFEDPSPSPTTPDALYVEEMLLQVMDDEFEANLEDGSAEEVARDVVRLWEEVGRGEGGLVGVFEERAERMEGKVPHGEDDEGDDDDDAPQLVERPPKQEPEVDEDGFTTVK
ncbi:hypothetical protein SERLADRAFT_342924, partial [Serpula lacrymans var. lacrymans S7.9]